MPPSKAEVMQELQEFLYGFAKSIGRVYGGDIESFLLGKDIESGVLVKPEDCNFEGSNFWPVISKMYDFGISGFADKQYGSGMLDGGEADVDLFFRSVKGLETFLAEDFVLIPTKVIRCVKTAVARHILEGGKRYADMEQEVIGEDAGALLTIQEVALLADMDERSVRNACNPKLSDRLSTVALGTRTLVEPNAAKNWLEHRKGYQPLRRHGTPTPSPSTTQQRITVDLPQELAQQLMNASRACDMTLEEYLIQRIQG